MAGSGLELGSELAKGNDTDVYTVFLREGEVYDFWLGGQPTEGDGFIADPLLQLSGGPGAPVTITNDDGAEGLDATLTFTPPAGGSGFYQVTVQDTAHVGGLYNLEIVNRSLDPDLSDHVFAMSGNKPAAFGTLTELVNGDVLLSSISASDNDEGDTVAVLLEAGVTYTFTMKGASTGDGTLPGAILRLLNADGVEQNVGGGQGENASFTFKPTQGGVFFLQGFSADGDPGTYAMQFTGGTPSDVAGNANTLANLPLGDAIQGEIGPGDEGSDWYAIHLVAGQQYQFDLAGLTLADPGLTLRNGAGAVVVQGSDVAGGVDDRITFTATTSGLFFLDVHDEGNATGRFELSGHRLGAAPSPVYSVSGDDADALAGGSEQADSLAGGDGSDFIFSQDGNDTITGGAGDDALLAGSGQDSVDGGDGDDLVSGDLGNDTVVGGAGDDVMFGDDDVTSLVAGPAPGGADRLFGGIGNDTLDGGGGSDTEAGGAGNDTYVVDSLGDVVGENANEGIDTVDARLSYTLGANLENLTLLDSFNFNGTGNALANGMFGNLGANLLNGLAGNDTLNGGQGNDTLVGGAGKDLLTGSGGLDHMAFRSLSDSGPLFAQRDAINTFAHGDKIDLSAIDANSKLAGNQAFTFVTNFSHVAGQVQFDQVAANSWFISADVNGDGVADFSLNVFSAPGFGQLHGFDFIL